MTLGHDSRSYCASFFEWHIHCATTDSATMQWYTDTNVTKKRTMNIEKLVEYDILSMDSLCSLCRTGSPCCCVLCRVLIWSNATNLSNVVLNIVSLSVCVISMVMHGDVSVPKLHNNPMHRRYLPYDACLWWNCWREDGLRLCIVLEITVISH